MSTITNLEGSTPVTTAGAAAIINNNFDALNDEKIETSYLDTDTSLTANSDTKIATQKAVKAYVDSGGNPNASETARGIVEEATDAEVTAGTATGATGAKLFVTPAKLATFVGGSGTNPVVRTYLNAASPATWTKPTGLKYVIVEVQAAGGGGGGTTANDEACGGGGAGGYAKKLITSATLGATETVTIGANGTAGAGGGGDGGNGGDVSFGTLVTATGGVGGSGNGTPTGGAGGSGASGDFNCAGGDGQIGFVSGTASANLGGQGGSAVLGGGGKGGRSLAGSAGKSYGGGGGGAGGDGADRAGGAGGAGIVIVTEYYI